MKTASFILVLAVAVVSSLTGMLMIANPKGETLALSTDILTNTPFSNFMIPGILLLSLVGGISMIAVFSYMEKSKNYPSVYLAAGGGLIAWTILQAILIRTGFSLPLILLSVAIMMILTSLQLKGKWLV